MSFKSTLQSECKWLKVLAVWRCVSVYSSRHYLALLERCLLALCICILKSRPDRSVFSHRLPLSAWVFASGKFCDSILIKFSSRLYLVKPSWDSEHVHVCQSGKCTYACCVYVLHMCDYAVICSSWSVCHFQWLCGWLLYAWLYFKLCLCCWTNQSAKSAKNDANVEWVTEIFISLELFC